MSSKAPRIDRFEKNFAYNSDMAIWQRGTSHGGLSALDLNFYQADRWSYRFQATGGTADNTFFQIEDAPSNTPLRYSGRIQSGGAAASTDVVQNGFRQIYEKSDTRELIQDGEISLAFYYKSSKVGTHAISFDIQGFTGSNPGAIPFQVAQADTWQRYVFTIDVSAKTNNDDGVTAETSPGMLLNIGPRAGSLGFTDWSVGDNAFLTGVMLVRGKAPSANGWHLRGLDPGNELRLCQRYYEKSYDVGTPPGSNTTNGRWYQSVQQTSGADAANTTVPFKVTKRALASINIWNAIGNANQILWFGVATSNSNHSSFAITGNADSGFQLDVNGISTGVRGNSNSVAFHWDADAEL